MYVVLLHFKYSFAVERLRNPGLHAVPKMKKQTVDVECVAGTYMRLDIPQILDNAMAFQGDAGMQCLNLFRLWGVISGLGFRV